MLYKERGNFLFNDALNAFYLRLYGVRHMVKDHSYGPLFPISSKGSFISHRQDNTYHELCYTCRGAQARAINKLMGPP